jgi:hypothetical protein
MKATYEINDDAVRAHIEQFTGKLHTGLRQSITQLTDQLLARVRAAEPYRTGRLRSETRAFVDDKADAVQGRVRVLGQGREHNAAAGALEYGAHRLVNVRAHREHLTHVFDRATDSQFVAVKAYTRRANIQAKRFVRDPAAAMRPRIEAEIERVVGESLR